MGKEAMAGWGNIQWKIRSYYEQLPEQRLLGDMNLIPSKAKGNSQVKYFPSSLIRMFLIL